MEIETEKTILDIFENSLSDKPYFSNNFEYGLKIGSRSNARHYAYIQHNHPKKIVFAVFDIDRYEQSFYAYEAANLPQPNIIVKNPENGNCHYFYYLERPIWTHDKASRKAQDYYQAIYFGYAKALDADLSYKQHTCKNPLSDRWEVFCLHSNCFELGYLADFVDLPAFVPAYRKKSNNTLAEGRNSSLFNALRDYSYTVKTTNYQQTASQGYDDFYSDLERHADYINNNFTEPLSSREVASIIKSVANWVWYKYDAKGKNICERGKLGFGKTRHDNPDAPLLADDEVRYRRQQSAIETNRIRKQKTEIKIKSAIEQLELEGKRVSISNVANLTGLARSNIYKEYAYLF
jgi:hypothetical protein